MKRALNLVLYLIISQVLFAQPSTKNDVIFKLNGDELSGKVIEISDQEVKFSYPGETLVYSIKKIDIFKITYASGRTELFNKTLPSESKVDPSSGSKSSPPEKSGEDHHSRVAVLPFSYI